MRALLKLLLLLPLAALAQGDPRVELAAKLDGVKPADLRPSPIPGLFELTRGAEVAYVSADGKYMLGGDLFEISKKGDYPNLTDQRRRELRLKLLAEVPETEMVVFAPAKPTHTITVFTDPDC